MRRYKLGIRCPKCGDKLFSWTTHDFQTCSCGQCFIDGGFDYNHIGWQDDDKYFEVNRVWGSIPVWLDNSEYKPRLERTTSFSFKSGLIEYSELVRQLCDKTKN